MSDKDAPVVLVIEKDQDVQNQVSVLLRHSFSIISTDNGEKGLEYARSLKPDLIISDVGTPNISGYELTKRLKATPELESIPVILLTSSNDLDTMIRGFEAGADDFIFRPFEISEFIVRVKSWVKSRNYHKMLAEKNKIIADRNEIIESELDMARSIQAKLLPENLPRIPGYDIAAIYLPMDKVGGDYYDFALHDNSLDIIIADATGHGIPAAFLASITKVAFQFSSDPENNPKKLIEILDKTIHERSVDSFYVTCLVGRLNTSSNNFVFTNAGHCSPLLNRRSQNKTIKLEQINIPLGLLYDEPNRKKLTYEESSIQLRSGDRLIFFTDGITEANNESGNMFGEENLTRVIGEKTDLSAKELTAEILRSLKAFCGSKKFLDDITLLIIDLL